MARTHEAAFRTEVATKMARDFDAAAIEQIIEACEHRSSLLRARASLGNTPAERIAFSFDAGQFSAIADKLRLLLVTPGDA